MDNGIDLEKIKRKALENILLPLGDKLSGQYIMKQYSFFKDAQWWPTERLEEFQNSKLRETIAAAYRDTEFYKKLYDQYKVEPSDIKQVEDLQKLPIVTKDMLRKAYPQSCTRESMQPWKEYFTSGSTGRPFVVRLDNYTMSIARALMLLRANFSGWQLGESYLQTGMTLQRGIIKWAKDTLLNISYVSAFDLSDTVLDRYLELIETKKHRYIMGYAASIYCIAKRAQKVGFNSTIQGIVSWGDNMYAHYRKLIEKQFHCRVTDTYGCGEGIQVAAQCEMGQYHVFTPHVVIEFLKEGSICKPGELGEIVLTRLNPGAMPLIRYKIGDVGKDSQSQVCSCGRGFKMIGSVEGRDSDIIVTPRGNRLIVHFFTGIFEYARMVDTFQIVQENSEEILVRIVPLPGFDTQTWEWLKQEILTKGDPDLRINLEIVKEIPLEGSNKRRFVISKIAQRFN
jgi:phenylacetate-CoA ligase